MSAIAEPPGPTGRGVPRASARLPDAVIEALATGRSPIPVALRGRALISEPLLYKGTAFTRDERISLEVEGLLPPGIINIEQQCALELEHLRRKPDPLERYIGLAATHDRNETLFFHLLTQNLEEFLPIVYTPTVGLACQQFSHILRRPRGVWISPDDTGRVPNLLANAARGEVRLIVVTDNERILGLGDQGAGGMPIPIGKLALYTAAAGIHPAHTLPVSLDVGTDRQALLDDPLYMGWRGRRLRGPTYDEVVEAFVAGVERVFPRAVVQWEDFKQHNALRLLDRFRDRLPSFNDDIQGTSAVAVAGILAGLRRTGRPLREQRFVLAGGGAAGIGIARLIAIALAGAGVDRVAAHRAIIVLDSHGLIHDGRSDLQDDKLPVALSAAERAAVGLPGRGPFDLETVVAAVHPTVLIGTTGQAGAFTEPIIRAMGEGTPEPIIMPLSNPTSNTEAIPADIIAWTSGRALVATGSPFDPVTTSYSVHTIGQANNVHIFPGIGLGAIVAETRVVPDVAFLRAAETLAAQVTDEDLAAGSLYPPISALRANARLIAIEVVRVLRDQGLGRPYDDEEILAAVDAAIWRPAYLPYSAS